MEEYIDNNDDPIELEIPIYLCDDSNKELFLIQYPTRLPWRPFDLSYVNDIRYKPEQKGIEMDVTIPQEYIDEESTYKISSQTYNSITTEIRSNYGVGFLKEIKKQPILVLFPVSHVSQMRPQFNYIETDIKETKKENETVKEENKKRIAVSAAPTKKQKDLEQLKKDEAEEAIKMKLYDTTSNETINIIENMIKNTKGKIEWETNINDYINKLAPLIEEETVILPNRDRIIDTLKIGKIMKLKRIVDLLNVKEDIVMGWLSELCYSVKGSLVLKTDFIPEIGERENCVREYILSLLTN